VDVAPDTTSDTTPSAPQNCIVDLYGDSIAAGANMFGYLNPVPAKGLERLRPKLKVVDHAVSGQTAAQAAVPFVQEQRTGAVVVIEHGTNDMTLGLDPVPPIKAMVATARSEGRVVIVTGLSRRGHPTFEATARAIEKAAVESGAMYADWPSLQGQTVDGTHPNQQFSNALVARLVEVIDQALPGCK